MLRRVHAVLLQPNLIDRAASCGLAGSLALDLEAFACMHVFSPAGKGSSSSSTVFRANLVRLSVLYFLPYHI